MMRFFTILGLTGLSLSMPLEHEHGLEKRGGGGSCTGGPWATDAFIEPSASPHGTPFCESGWGATFVPISAVTAWTSDYYCTGIQFTYADGTVGPVYGKATDQYAPRHIAVNYALGDKFDKAIMYGPPVNGLLTHLTLHASNGQKLNCGEAVSDGLVAHEQDVAAGIMLGAQGKSAANVDSLGFLFLRSAVTNVDVTNLTFPNGPTGSQGITPQTLATGHYYNAQDTGNTSWSFMDSKAVTDTQQYMQASASMYGNTVMFSVTAKIPIIDALSVTAGTSFTWSTTDTYTTSTTHTETTTVTWGQSGSLLPHTGVDCSAVVGEGAGTYPYTSTVTLKLADGTSVSFPEAGSLTFSDVSQAIVEVVDANHP